MQLHHRHERRRRARGAFLALIIGLAGLGLAFFNAQVVSTATFAVQSEANRLRPLSVPAPRGAVYDRDGEIIAENIPGYTLLMLPAPTDSIVARLDELNELLELGERRVQAAVARHRQFPNQPVVVASDLSFDQLSVLEERRAYYPGVYIEMRPKRHYPAGPAAAHLVGYVGEISRGELDAPRFAGYEAGQRIGKSGIERRYEGVLGGEPGIRYVEVDALGRVLNDQTRRPGVEPVPGGDLRLHVDLDTQQWVARIFPDSLRGAIVALEPGTGHVVALYSHPTFDPNELVGGVAPDRWRAIAADSTDPMLDRATAGLYPPGSTFKLVSAAIGLEAGVIDPQAYMPIPCRGGMRYGNRYFQCWEPAGHGFLTLPEAIKRSCNVYFYQLGVKLGLQRFLEEAGRLRISSVTGVDLPGEESGRFPDRPEWYEERFGGAPTRTEVLNLAIGQGPSAQSVIKMAQLYGALAGGGEIPAPRVAAAAPSSDADAGLDLGLSETNREWLLQGLRRVVEPDGTAHLASLEHWDLMGKTGTAQNPQGEDHGWFVGMAGPPDGEPEIVVAVILESAEHGWVAAQYSAKTADYYLRRTHDMPIDTVQTLREHLMAGRSTPWAEWE